jgi:hypothetical protein
LTYRGGRFKSVHPRHLHVHPDLRPLVERLDVMRWGHAMIRLRPGFVWGGARAAAARPYLGIHFAHSDLSGLALFEEAFYHGTRAAEAVLAERGLPVFQEFEAVLPLSEGQLP